MSRLNALFGATASRSAWPSRLWPDAVTVGTRRLACGDGYTATFTILDYPAALPFAWIETLLVSPQAHAEISVHVDPVPTDVAAGQLRKRRARMEATQRYTAAHGRLDDPRLAAAASDAAELADRLAGGETRLHRMAVYVTVHAETAEDLDLACARFRAAASAQLMDARPLTFRQLPGITATVPVGIDGPGCVKTVDTETVAGGFPFSSPEVPGTPSASAVLYGLNLASGAPVLWDRWAQDNHNSVVVARSGAGKSYFTKSELLRQLYSGVQVSVIDPDGEYRKLAEHVGGTVHTPGRGRSINPLALPAEAEPDALARRRMFVGTLVETALGEALTAAETALIDAAATQVYANAGITEDAATWQRTPPVAADLLAVLEAGGSEATSSLAARLAPYVSGGLSGLLADRPGAVDDIVTGAHLQVFDLSEVAEELAPLTTLVVLDQIWRSLRGDGRRRLIVVDEAWLLLSDGAGARFLSRTAKSARKRLAGLMVVTQDAGDLLGSELGHTVIANSATQILLRQAPQSVDAVAEAFGLTDAERGVIASARRGEALLLGGDAHVAFTAVAAPDEHELCLTGLASTGGEQR
jgi:type IV secretory pathway VirB4 component